jgi:hypothetical protein
MFFDQDGGSYAMSRFVSVGTKIQQLEGMLDTKDLSDWENTFLHGICEGTVGGLKTGGLSDKQLERIEALWERHFA